MYKINNIRILYLILSFLLIINNFFIKNVNCEFKILSSEIKEKNANTLDGTNLNFGYIDVELDDDLYKYDPLGCGNFNCNVLQYDGDCSCDYTDMTECPKSYNSNNPSCSATTDCPLVAEDGETLMCGNENDGSNKWITLKADDTQENTIFNSSNGETMYFKYKANSKICESLLVVAYPIVGFFRGSIGASPINQRKLPYEYVQTYNIMNLCPSDNQNYTNTKSWTSDTYYITIVPTTSTSNITFSLQIKSNKTPSLPSGGFGTCTNSDPTHKCILDGQVVTDEIQGPAYKYYSFTVEKAGYYIIGAPALFQDINLLVSDSGDNKFPTIQNPGKWISADEYDDYLIMYLDEPGVVLYIGIYCSYPSNFTFTITSQGYNYPVRIDTLPSNAGAYALTKTSRILLPDGSALNCPSWYLCLTYSSQFPLQDGNPLWPVPSLFIDSDSYRNIDFQDAFLANPVKPKSYQSSVLLSSKVGSSNAHTYQKIETISNSTIQFISSIFNSKGEPLRGSSPFTFVELNTCNYTQFQLILDAIEKTQDILFGVLDLKSLNDWRYRLEALTIRDDWIGCSNQAASLLNTVSVLKNVSSTFCPYSLNDASYATDPCCNSSLTFFQCCNPKNVQVSTIQFVGTFDDEIQQQCSSFECTQSVLSEYYKSLSSADECSVSSFTTKNMRQSVVQVLKNCNTYQEPEKYCTVDSDCNGTKCDLYSRECLPNFIAQDKQYVGCVLSNLSPSTLYAFLQIAPSQVNDELVESIYNGYQRDDCMSHSTVVDGFRQGIVYTSPQIPDGRCYPVVNCLDLSCQLEHDICFDQVFTEFQSYPSIELDQCSYYGYCPLESLCPHIDGFGSDCENDCNSVTEFCGHCTSENQTFCHHVTQYNDPSSCTQASACLLPNGDYISDGSITKEQCELNYGSCTGGNCGYECSGYQGCLITSATSKTACDAIANSNWDSDYQFCSLNGATQSTCTTTGLWIDCSSKSIDQCYGPNSNLLSMCSLIPIECKTKESCLSSGGECSDFYFFQSSNTINYPDGLGKCVRDHYSYRSGFYPSCDFENENDSPMGCFSHVPIHLNKASCESIPGNKWWTPSLNKSQCTSSYGCKTLEVNSDNLEFNTRFNQMSQELCTNCFESSNQWTNKFEWKDAKWLPGVFIENLSWKSNNKFSSIATREKSFNYQLFYQNLMSTVDTLTADLLRSETFCRMERLQSNLNSIACSCSGGEGGSQCFKESLPLIGQTKACFGESSKFTFDYGQIIFESDSIEQGCPSLLVSRYSKEIFTSTAPESLPSNFVSYQVPEKYGVLNKNDAIVGILLNDGIYIKSQFSIVKQFTICFTIDQTKDSKYSIYDFATLNNIDGSDNGDSGNDNELYPLGIETFIINSNTSSSGSGSTDESIYLCSNFNNFKKDSTIQSYFPIKRIDGDWENKSKEVFDKSTRGLLYTLAVIYLVVSIWGFVQMGIIVYNQVKGGEIKFQLIHSLTLIITIFIFIRSMYFFVLPDGHLAQNPVGDYILVILPTFIYFTAYTIIIVLWYVIVFLVLKKNKSAQSLTKRVSIMALLINIVIYLLFIACALVFTKTQPSSTNDCGSRIIIEATSSIPQKAISITYAIIQTVISVILGFSFVYLGSSLFLTMHKTKKALGGISKNSHHHKRIFLLTLICSIGFILHCIFILILVSGHSSIAFSFIGLIITEIIPSLTILYCYDPRLKLANKTSSGGTSNVMSNVNTSS